MVHLAYRPMQSSLTFLRAIARAVALGLPVAVSARDGLGTPAVVDGSSMQPTLNPGYSLHRDVVWVQRTCRQDLHAGAIVACISPEDPRERLIKRVVAVEGDVICKRGSPVLVEVPKGHCWVEGDGSRHSHDSNAYGPISTGLIWGRVVHVVWPPGRMQRLPQKLSQEQQERVLQLVDH